MKKYKIIECLEKLTVKEYRIVMKALPGIVGKSHNTFWNYANIEINAEQDIPYIVVIKLEQFFGLNPGGLINLSIDSPSYQQIVNRHQKSTG